MNFEIHQHPEGTTEVQWCDGGAAWKAHIKADGTARIWIMDGGNKSELTGDAVHKFRPMYVNALKAVGYEAFSAVSKIWDATVPK